jgi:hypothetical protein
MDEIRNQIASKLKEANSILITVSTNPSVDQLAGAIATALFLNKIGKHSTAVFSGEIPDSIDFLKPDETLKKNTDSLRDFIISLDKAKADKLRYKVEDNFVKIFITPFDAAIAEKDLIYSQGEINVDVIVALGVEKREEIDKAISAHGNILHDATVITINAGDPSDIGSLNWGEKSSSLCEMLTHLADRLKEQGLLDAQIANSLLTGIVSATQRFSNEKTTTFTMSVGSRLLAAGANPQLVAKELEPAVKKAKPNTSKDSSSESTKQDDDNDKDKQPPAGPQPEEPKPSEPPESTEPPKSDNHPDAGTLSINHDEEKGDSNESSAEPIEDRPVDQVYIDDHGNLQTGPQGSTPNLSPGTESEHQLTLPPSPGSQPDFSQPLPSISPSNESTSLPDANIMPTLSPDTEQHDEPASALENGQQPDLPLQPQVPAPSFDPSSFIKPQASLPQDTPILQHDSSPVQPPEQPQFVSEPVVAPNSDLESVRNAVDQALAAGGTAPVSGNLVDQSGEVFKAVPPVSTNPISPPPSPEDPFMPPPPPVPPPLLQPPHDENNNLPNSFPQP